MTFTSISGTTYYAGETISYSEYSFLNLKEKGNFRQKEEDVIDTIVDTALDIGLGMAIGSMLSGSNDDSSSTTPDVDSFEGFGGGDFGGAGASTDF